MRQIIEHSTANAVRYDNVCLDRSQWLKTTQAASGRPQTACPPCVAPARSAADAAAASPAATARSSAFVPRAGAAAADGLRAAGAPPPSTGFEATQPISAGGLWRARRRPRAETLRPKGRCHESRGTGRVPGHSLIRRKRRDLACPVMMSGDVAREWRVRAPAHGASAPLPACPHADSSADTDGSAANRVMTERVLHVIAARSVQKPFLRLAPTTAGITQHHPPRRQRGRRGGGGQQAAAAVSVRLVAATRSDASHAGGVNAAAAGCVHVACGITRPRRRRR
jgi:hypothetical protein